MWGWGRKALPDRRISTNSGRNLQAELHSARRSGCYMCTEGASISEWEVLEEVTFHMNL